MTLSKYLSTGITYDCMHTLAVCINAGQYLTYKKITFNGYFSVNCEFLINPTAEDYFSLAFKQGMEVITNILHSV